MEERKGKRQMTSKTQKKRMILSCFDEDIKVALDEDFFGKFFLSTYDSFSFSSHQHYYLNRDLMLDGWFDFIEVKYAQNRSNNDKSFSSLLYYNDKVYYLKNVYFFSPNSTQLEVTINDEDKVIETMAGLKRLFKSFEIVKEEKI